MQDAIARILAYGYAAWRRRGYAIAVAWAVCVAGWSFVAVMPDIYRSSALVHVDTASVLQPLLQNLTIEFDRMAEVELMQRTLLSQPNIETVIRATDLDLVAKTSSDMARLIQDLRRRIRLERQGENLFRISFEDNDPKLAHQVVQELMSIFVGAVLGQGQGELDTARRFIENQIAQYEKKLARAEQDIIDFNQENFGLLGETSDYLRMYETIQVKVAEIDADLRAARVRRGKLRNELEFTPRILSNAMAFGPGPPSDTAIRIMETQHELEGLRSQFTDKHPDVVVAQRRLDALLEQQRREHEATAAIADKTSADGGSLERDGVSNPVYEKIKIELVEVEAEIAGLEDRLAQARAGVVKTREDLDQIPAIRAELARLERNYDLHLSSYQKLLASRETEQMSRARDFQAESVRFQILEPPSVPAIPSDQYRLVLLAAVLVIGIGSGTGFAILLAISSDTISSLVELRTAVSIPVLGSISIAEYAHRGFWSHGKTVAFWFAAFTLCITFAALWFVEMRVGLNELVMNQWLAGGAPDWLRRLPVF